MWVPKEVLYNGTDKAFMVRHSVTSAVLRCGVKLSEPILFDTFKDAYRVCLAMNEVSYR